MLEECGIVVRTDKEYAWIETARKAACSGCSANQSCGTSSLAQVLGNKSTHIKVANQLSAQVGDRVILGIQEQALLKTSLALYLIPLFFMFGTAIGYNILVTKIHLPPHEYMTALAGLVGLGLGFASIKWMTLKMSKNPYYHPVMLRVE